MLFLGGLERFDTRSPPLFEATSTKYAVLQQACGPAVMSEHTTRSSSKTVRILRSVNTVASITDLKPEREPA